MTNAADTLHTPWETLDICEGIAIIDRRNVTIAYCDYSTEADQTPLPATETKAHARLIAAAPDLLTALDCLLIYAADIHSEDLDLEVYEQARAAIRQATGG